MQSHRKFTALSLIMTATVLIAALCLSYSFSSKHPAPETPATAEAASTDTVTLTEGQLNAIKIEPAGTYRFTLEKRAIGSIAYHEQDASHALPWMPDGPAPHAAAKASTKLIVASVSETDSPQIHVGESVKVQVAAYPGLTFDGKVLTLGGTIWDSGGNPAVDPVTRRIAVRCEIADPENKLYPGMFANIAIQVQDSLESVAVPVNGVVREGDGTMTVWATEDKKHFKERVVKVGLEQNGYDQILDGLKSGELVATDGALFLDNALAATSQ